MPTGTNKTIAAGLTEFEWEVRESRSGTPTLLLGGRAVYSQYDPLKNAAELAGQIKEQMAREGCDHLVLIGSGLGYLPVALQDAGVERMVVWEPFSGMQKVFGHLYQDGPERVFDEEAFMEKIKALARKGAKPQLAIHPGYPLFCRLEYRQATAQLESIYRSSVSSGIISRRSLETLERLPRFRTIARLQNAFRGRVAVVTGPGPSLLPYLPALRNRSAVLFSSLRAVPILQNAGINPDFVVNCDVPDMTDLLRDIGGGYGAMLLDTCCHPSIMDYDPERTYLFNLRSGQLHERLWEGAGLPVFSEPMATVSETMVRLAAYMGFTTIICLGIDLCWSDERYAVTRATRYDERNATHEQRFELLDLHKQKVFSKAVYFQAARFLSYYTARLGARGCRMVQADGGLGLGMETVGVAEAARLAAADAPVRIPDISPGEEFSAADVVQCLTDILSHPPGSAQPKAEATAVRPQVHLWDDLQQIPDGDWQVYAGTLVNRLRT